MLPASESVFPGMCRVSVESVDDLVLTNDTGADLAAGDFAIINGIHPAIAKEAIANAANGSFNTKIETKVETAALLSGSDTFATKGQPVFWSPVDKKFSDTNGVGYYLVGRLSAVKDSAGVIVFTRLRHASKLNMVEAGKIGWIEYAVGADHSTAIAKNFGFNFTVLDAFVLCTAANASGTITAQNNAGTAITNAMTCAVADAIGRATSIAAATNAITNGIVKFKANGAADRGIAYLLVKGN